MKYTALIPAHITNDGDADILLSEVNGKPVIATTHDAIVNTGLFHKVLVVTNSNALLQTLQVNGCDAVKCKEHNTAMDCIAEVAMDTETDIIVHIPANIPFTSKTSLQKLLNIFEGEYGKNTQVASIVQKIKETADISNAEVVKAALDLRQNALFLSRGVIPYLRNNAFAINYYKHVPIYAYRKIELLNFALLPKSPLETAEQIEGLRFLENGIPIRMIISQYPDITIRSKEDIVKAEAYNSYISA